MGRGGRTGGNLFDGGEPEDEIPLSDLIPGLSRERGARRSRPVTPMWVRAAGPVRPARVRGVRTRTVAAPRMWWVVVRCVLVGASLLLGVLMMVTGSVSAASGYAAAGRMAAAPACPAGVDLVTDTADCVGNEVLGEQGGAYDGGDGDELDIPVSAADGYYLWPDYPANAEFDAVLGDDDSFPVRAEFWEGNIVTLTAARGADVQTVTTNENPNNQGGTGLGGALLGVGFVDLGLLLLIGIRGFRLRWLRPGLGLRLAVSGMLVGLVGVFVAAGCMLVQPARVLLTLTIAPSITAGVLLLVWLAVFNNLRRQGLRGPAYTRGALR